jgi:hypothetical protein
MERNRHYAEHAPAGDSLPQFVGLVALLFGVAAAWPALFVGLMLRMLIGRFRRLGWALWLVVFALGVLWAVRTHLRHAIPLEAMTLRYLLVSRQWSALVPHLVPLWRESLLLAPLVALVLFALSILRGRQHEEDVVLASMKAITAEEQRRASVAARQVRRAPSSLVGDQQENGEYGARPAAVVRKIRACRRGTNEVRRHVVLGAAVSGDLAPAGSVWRTRRGPSGGWVTIPAQELRLPGAIIGASGSGKTQTALRLAAETAGALGWQVIYLDAKGDYATAARYFAAMTAAGVPASRIAMFPARSYDGWRGDGAGILNRLLATQDFTEEYYQAVAKQLLYLTLTLPNRGRRASTDGTKATGAAANGPGALPRGSHEMLRRLQLSRLQTAYKGRPEEGKLAGIDPKQAHGVLARYDGFFTTLAGKLDGDWSYEDVDAAYLLLDGLALREEAASLGRYLLEDFAHYAAKRKDPRRQTLLIIDEYSALSLQTDAANLFERLRSYGASIFVSAQSYAGLGSGVERILDTANLLIVQRTNDPRRLIERAGMVRRVEASHTIEDEMATGRRTVRGQDQVRVDPDAVRQLEVGEAVLIAHGRSERICVAPLRISEQAVAQAEEEMRAMRRASEAIEAMAPNAASRRSEGAGAVEDEGAHARTRPANTVDALTEAPSLSGVKFGLMPGPTIAAQSVHASSRPTAPSGTSEVAPAAKRKRARTKRHPARKERVEDREECSEAPAFVGGHAPIASGAAQVGEVSGRSAHQRDVEPRSMVPADEVAPETP